MEHSARRTLVSQLADDLGTLEEHARERLGDGLEAAGLRFAAALVRNVLGPWLEDRSTRPLHVAVVGGAGAGKSTIANFLCGGPVAEANPQAGYTRHPVGYVAADQPVAWTDYLGFLGPLKRLNLPGPSNLDEDVYQIRRVGEESKDATLLRSAVVWDCPDMTTAAAAAYQSRLLEVAALADVLIYVASDERYNDEVPTQFLRHFLSAGKAVVVCLVKMNEADAEAFIAHFDREVLSTVPAKANAVLAIPHLPFPRLQDPVEQAASHRGRLLEAVHRLLDDPEAARRQTASAALAHLKNRRPELEAVARQDLAALDAWRDLVQAGRAEFEERYRREFLNGERFRRFDMAYERLVELLELPGLGKVVSGVLYILRTPYRVLRGWFTQALLRPPVAPMPEKPVLDGALAGWLDQLRKETMRRAAEHSLWKHVRHGFETGLPQQAQDRFEENWRAFHLSVATEVEAAARRVTERLENQPAGLQVVRAAKFAAEGGVTLALLLSLGFGIFALVLIPLAVSLTQHAVELIAKAYVDHQRVRIRGRQQEMLHQQIAEPLADWLAAWPATGGSRYERLQTALARLGPALAEVEKAL